MLAAATRLLLVLLLLLRLSRGGGDARQLEDELPLEPVERLARRLPSIVIGNPARELRVEIAHADEERYDRRDELREAERPDHLQHPRLEGFNVRRLRAGVR